jgi:hypothetical protein
MIYASLPCKLLNMYALINRTSDLMNASGTSGARQQDKAGSKGAPPSAPLSVVCGPAGKRVSLLKRSIDGTEPVGLWGH